MATDLPKEVIRTLVASLSGIPASRVRWQGEAERVALPIGGKSGKITLNVVALTEGDAMESRRAYDAATKTLTQQWGATEEITISVRADNFLGAGEAYNLLRKVRFALMQWGGTTQATLNTAGLAYIEAPSITKLDYEVDNREISSASLDIRLANLITSELQELPWIEKLTSKSPPFTDEQVAALPPVDLALTRTPTPVGQVPIISAVSYGVVDIEGGGQPVVVNVDNSTGCSAMQIGGVACTSFTIVDRTHVSGIPGAHAAGIVDVVVTNAVGPSTTGNGLVQYWYPGTEPSCTLLVEMPDYAAGTWTARVGGNLTASGVAPVAAAGEPTFVNTGHLVSAATLNVLLGVSAGTIFSVQAPTSETNPEGVPQYNNRGIWAGAGSGPIGLYNASDGVDHWYGLFLFDGTAYVPVRVDVAGLTSGRHAVVGTYDATRLRLSVNGSAFAGATAATAGGPLSIVGASPFNVGRDYSGAVGFSGTIRVFATFTAEADDVIAMRCYQWARQRHAI